AAAIGFSAPLHALITGRKDERDRRIAIVAAPRFGIVGQQQTITYRLNMTVFQEFLAGIAGLFRQGGTHDEN
ncbi:MAG: hypothetical protein IJV58_04505, partial [Oscillospiraceae bacterium]|nr:hypothetical protein [Oscillospiraceae bacterium]